MRLSEELRGMAEQVASKKILRLSKQAKELERKADLYDSKEAEVLEDRLIS